jgi:autotransporter translocation and assembly factor TamB
MGRAIRYLKRAVAALAILIALLCAAAVVFMRTPAFGRIARAQANAWLAANMRGAIAIGGIAPSWSGAIVIDDISVANAAGSILRIPRATIGYALVPLLWREIRLEVEIERPEINLARDASGEWNIVDAFAPRTPAPAARSAPSTFTVSIERIAISGGALALTMPGLCRAGCQARLAEIRGTLDLPPSGLRLALTEISLGIEAPGLPRATIGGALTLRDRDGRLDLDAQSITIATAHSALDVDGKYRAGAPFRVDAELRLKRLAAADLAALVPRSPLRDDLAGAISIKGAANALELAGGLRAGRASLDFSGTADLTVKAPSFTAAAKLASLDLTRLDLARAGAAAAGISGTVQAALTARGAGDDFDAFIATVDLSGSRLRWGEIRNGNLKLNGGLKRGRARIALSFDDARGGKIILDGDGLVSASPSYNLTLAAERLNLAGLLRSAPPTNLNARLKINGAGLAPEKINARVTFAVRPSRLGAAAIDSVSGAVQIGNGRAMISAVRVASAGVTLALDGVVGIARGAATRVGFQIDAPSLKPWLAMAGIAGAGTLRMRGVASGYLARAHTAGFALDGSANLTGIAASGVKIASGAMKFTLGGVGAAAIPAGAAEINLSGIEARGLKLRDLVAGARVSAGRPQSAAATLLVHDNARRTYAAAANFSIANGRIAGRLESLSLELPGGAWRLARPASFSRDAHEITVGGFALAHGASEIALDAAVSAGRSQKFDLRLSGIGLAALAPLFQSKAAPDGTLDATIAVAGTASTPAIALRAAVAALAFNGQRVGDVKLKSDYQGVAMTLDATLAQDAAHVLRVQGDVPLALGFARGIEIRLEPHADLRIATTGIRLAPFLAAAPGQIRNGRGLLVANLEARGALTRPQVTGTLGIDSGAAEIRPLGVKVEALTVNLRMAPDSVTVERFAARAGGGTINGGGAIALNDYAPGKFALRLSAHRWPAIATRQYSATIDAAIVAAGSLDTPRVSGRVDVTAATIRPDLAFLDQSQPLARDPTIEVIEPGAKTPAGAQQGSAAAREAPPKPNGPISNMAIDLRIVVHRNAWIRHPDAEAELDGALTVRKHPGGPIAIAGEIHTMRGWIVFQGRRLDLEYGRFIFTGGGKIDPTLDLDARMTLSNYIVDVLVTGVASKPALKLRSVPELPQTDILSLILFGRTSASLGQSQQSNLQQQAATMAAGAAASTIGQSVASSLGLQSAGITVGSGGVGFGKYVTKNTYVSASQNLSGGPQARKASVQYYFMRWLSIKTSMLADGSSEIFLNISKQY